MNLILHKSHFVSSLLTSRHHVTVICDVDGSFAVKFDFLPLQLNYAQGVDLLG